jgi:hypothetical protein
MNDDFNNILLESFADPKHEWVEMNDPVMGGKSTGSFHIDEENEMGIFMGTVNNVPFLHAPGFIQVRTIVSSLSFSSNIQYPDISHCQAFELIVTSQYPQYQGYRMSFGTQHAPHGKMFAYGYKTHFTFENATTTNSNHHSMNGSKNDTIFQSIILPFDQFTDYWDDATGDAIVECDPNDSIKRIYCPTPEVLQNIQTIGLWGEGYVGKVSINIQAIYATQCHKNNNIDGNVAARGSISLNDAQSWWSQLNLLLFGNTKTDAKATTSSLSRRDPTTITTAILQRNMLLSSLSHHRW